MKRVVLYALVYGAIGAGLGVCVALYTQDAEIPRKIILSKNGAVTKSVVSPSPSPAVEVAAPTHSEEE